MSKREIIKLIIAGGAFAGVLAYLISKDIINTAQAIESTILFVLVCVTTIYAKRTAEIARETREQRYSESLPLLVPTIPSIVDPITNIPNPDPIEVDYDRVQAGIQATLHNLGTGIAINVRVSFWPAPILACTYG